MKTEEEIREMIKFAEEKVDFFYEEGDFMQKNSWADFADGLKWVLGEE